MTPITVIQTADMHGRLTLQIATRLAEFKRGESALLFDCGDSLDLPNYLPLPRTPEVIAAMNAAGYDAMALGNREYGWRRSTTAAKLAGLEFPVLCANIASGGADSEILKPYITLRLGECTIGVFGLSPNMAPSGSIAQRTSDVRFIDAEEAGQQAIADLRSESDIIIGLLHWGTNMEQQTRLVEKLPGLDLALAAHWHVTAGSLMQVGDVAVSRCTCHARQAAILRRQPDGDWEQELVGLQ